MKYDWAKVANGGVELVSRHVQCGVYISSDFDITGADDTDYGKFRWEVRVGSHDLANGLNKTFNFSTVISKFSNPAHSLTSHADTV